MEEDEHGQWWCPVPVAGGLSNGTAAAGDEAGDSLLAWTWTLPLLVQALCGLAELVLACRTSGLSSSLAHPATAWTPLRLLALATTTVLGLALYQGHSGAAGAWPCLVVTGSILLLAALAQGKNAAMSLLQWTLWTLLVACQSSLAKTLDPGLVHSGRCVSSICLAVCHVINTASLLLPPGLKPDKMLTEVWTKLTRGASILTFSWMDDLMRLGRAKESLTTEDFPEMPQDLKGRDFWDKCESVSNRSGQRNILVDLLRAFSGTVALNLLLKVVLDVVTLLNPLILKLFIQSLEGDKWSSYMWALVFFASLTCHVTIWQQVYRLNFTVGHKMRTATLLALYKKGLVLSPSDRSRYTTGEVTNLMAVDCQRLFLSPLPCVNMTGPVQLVICAYMLYQLVGVAGIIALCVMSLLVPINIMASAQIKKLQSRLNLARDKRLRMLNEALLGIKVLKLYGWDDLFLEKILAQREEEVSSLSRIANIMQIMRITLRQSGPLMMFVMFTSFIPYLNPKSELLVAENIFIAMALFNIARYPLYNLSNDVMYLMQLSLSVQRINTFLACEEVPLKTHEEQNYPLGSRNLVEMQQADTFWGRCDNQAFKLKNLNLKLREGTLTAVLGNVGSGKSSLLSSILRDMNLECGKVRASGKIAYVPQDAWIQHASLRDNILFGKVFEQNDYSKVLSATDLLRDISLLPAGDLTRIGERGVNLSGGQKQRVSLARAGYSGADLILLDDPLSAVDSTMGEYIFKNLICGLMKGKTRLLVTHNLSLLPDVDRILLMDSGCLVADGTYDDLYKNSEKFRCFVQRTSVMEKDTWSKKVKVNNPSIQPEDSFTMDQMSIDSNMVEDERMELGAVKFQHFRYYLDIVGMPYLLAGVLLMCGSTFLESIGTSFYSEWADGVKNRKLLFNLEIETDNSFSQTRKVGVYYLASWVLLVTSVVLLLRRFAECSRFSSDLTVLDECLPLEILATIECACGIVTVFAIVCFQIPVILIVLTGVFCTSCGIQRYYASTQRQLKRLESVSLSPVFTYFSETMQGAAVIRAYGAQRRFRLMNSENVRKNLACGYMNDMSKRWLGTRMDHLGNIIVICIATFAVWTSLSVGTASMLVTIATAIMSKNSWLIRNICEVESDSVVLERLREYENLPAEGEWSTKDMASVPKLGEWPKDGRINFKNCSVKYRPHLGNVVKNVSLDIASGERLGICGRSGAGKSSLALSLFRLLNASSGSVSIAGRDICTVGLRDLRSQITIIPQDPVMFSGTLRMNLDPSAAFSDQEIWDALHHAQLTAFVYSLKNKLEHEMAEGGSAFSSGQRQLVCLARALLRKTKILVLDEATASMDPATDAVLQTTLARQFANCTVITIAHRLNTIMDYDRILVMENGEAVECDTPSNLLNKGSCFNHYFNSQKDIPEGKGNHCYPMNEKVEK